MSYKESLNPENSLQESIEQFLSKRSIMIVLTVVPVLVLFTFVTIIPALWLIYAGWNEISSFSPDWTFVGIENYINVISSGAFWGAMQKSLLFTIGSVFVQFVAGMSIAFLINRKFRFASVVRAIVFLPYMIPTAILGLIGLWMGNSQWGIINQALYQIGLVDHYIPWFGSAKLAMIAVILTSSWKFSIFVTIMVLARLQSIPANFYEAAEMAGANSYQKFRDVTLPSLKGVIFIVLLLRGLWMFNKFDIIWTLTKGGPKDTTNTIAIYIYQTVFSGGDLGEAAAASTLLFILLAAVGVLYFYALEPTKEVSQT